LLNQANAQYFSSSPYIKLNQSPRLKSTWPGPIFSHLQISPSSLFQLFLSRTGKDILTKRNDDLFDDDILF